MAASPEQVDEIRRAVAARITLLPSDPISASDVQRYWRATEGSVKDAANRICETWQWRRERRPESIDCTVCLKDPSSHYLHLCGFDKLGRPVMYSNFLLVGNRTVKTLVDHMIQVFEMAVRLMPPGVEQWVWLNDFIGFGLMDCNPTLGLSFIHLLASHYPERLGQLLVLDAPGIMTPVWNMIKPFVGPVTFRKIRFLPNDLGQLADGKPSSLHQQLQEMLDDEMLSWVLNEMAAVRAFAKKKGPRPRYDLAELRACVKEGRIASLVAAAPAAASPAAPSPAAAPVSARAGAEAGTAAVRVGSDIADVTTAANAPLGHSHYGCQEFFLRLLKQPEVLFPPMPSEGAAIPAAPQ